jgi:PEP-CTERM motif-containing protein
VANQFFDDLAPACNINTKETLMITTIMRAAGLGVPCLRTTVVAVSLMAFCGTGLAENIIFTIDPSQSTESLSLTDSVLHAYSGNLSTSVRGNFMVTFDPSTNTPSQITLDGGHGFIQLDSPYTASPGLGGSGPPALANLAGHTSTNVITFATRALAWDFTSPTINTTGSGNFPANTTSYVITTGKLDTNVNGTPGSSIYSQHPGLITAGTWTLSESTPTSGDWTLGFNGHVDTGYTIPGFSTGSGAYTSSIVATAHFATTGAAANVAPVAVSETHADALGGATAPLPPGQPGGVSATLAAPAVATGTGTAGVPEVGTLSVQNIPTVEGLSPAAIAAAKADHLFGLVTPDRVQQIWDVNYSGALNGGSVLLTFHYNPDLLPAGTIESQLQVYHFNTITNNWDVGGTVHTGTHTIDFSTSSFSQIMVMSPTLAATPEPSTVTLFGLGTIALLGYAWRARKRKAVAA